MNVTATRRVSGPSSSPKVERKYSSAGGQSGQFVEHIDTTNNVLIRDDSDRNNRRQDQSKPDQEELENKQNSSTSQGGSNYVPNAIEAIAASGVYDNNPEVSNAVSSQKIGVYGSNQSFVKEENNDKISPGYIKRLYESTPPVEEVNELV